jgi:DNA primase
MSSYVPPDFIDNLLARVDIVEIIAPRVHLSKAGNDFKALCPFHNEKTPSFFVSSNKQFYHCFGCGVHGNAIGFLMEYDHLDFLEAVSQLANRLGVELPKEEREVNFDKAKNQKGYDLLAKTIEFYQKELIRSERAQEYLKSRQLNHDVCQRFSIGYAPAKSGELTAALKLNDDDLEVLFANGLLLKSDEGRVYDRFRDRIMFPIRDRRGRVIAFGGRSLGDDLPKYLNSPETPLFHKGDELYGLFEARRDNRKIEKLIVVEGYMDVIALAQYGINYAVASMGTAITAKQIQLLLRETSELIFCFDGDQAGQTAAWRALEIVLPLMRDGIYVRFFILPGEEDPDSYIRTFGAETFLKNLSQAYSLSDFLFDRLKVGINIDTPDGNATFAKKAKDLFNKMPNGVFKELLLKKLAELVKIDIGELKKIDFGVKKTHQMTKSNAGDKKKSTQIVEKAINLLLYYPELVKEVNDWQRLKELNLPYVSLLIWLVQLLQSQVDLTKVTIGTILSHCDNVEETQFLTRLATKMPLILAPGLKNEFLGTISKLISYVDETEMDLLLQKARAGNLTIDEKRHLQQLIAKTKYFN